MSNVVYKDTKGIDTVGVGHRVLSGDQLASGQRVADQWVIDQFARDVKSHKAYDFWKSSSKFNIAQGIALASFGWTHGAGIFWDSYTHNLFIDGKGEAEIMSWVALNWDRTSPVNQVRNKMDFSLFFPRVSNGIVYHASTGLSGTFVYIPSINESFTSVEAGLLAAKQKQGTVNNSGSVPVGQTPDEKKKMWLIVGCVIFLVLFLFGAKKIKKV